MTPVSTHPDRIPFDQLTAFSKLFTDYCQFSHNIAPFFSDDYREPSSYKSQVQRTLSIPRDRNSLVKVLLEQNSRWGLDEATQRNIEHLRDEDSVVVITGQQLGIFLSPLYIPYKTLTTIRLASQLSESLGRPVVPVFWLHGEDHDFEETVPFNVIDSNHNLVAHKYQPQTITGGPVGRMQFSPAISNLISELASSLPQTPNKKQLVDFLHQHYTPGTSLLDAFAFLLKRTFKDSGLVLFSVDNPLLKSNCKELFQKEIENPLLLSQAVEATSIKLAQSYHVQVKTNPINLFLMDDTSRQSINFQQENQFKIKGYNKNASTEDLLTTLDQSPDQFSPNVILRPIVQDFIFPSIAYVAGPGEIAYFAQCKDAYDAAGVPMPLIFPRASITLIEPDVARVLDRYSYDIPTYNEDPLKLFRNYALEHLSLDLDAAVNDSITQVQRALNELREQAMNVHPSLYRSAESTKVRFEKELLRFKEQVIKAQKKNTIEHQAHLGKAATHLFPNQKLQERVLSPLHFLNKYGLDFFSTLMKEVSMDTTAHQIIRL